MRKWGQWVKEEAEKELAEFYPKDEDGSTPIAYLWARTIISEAPDDGTGIPVEVPLMRSLWLAKKASRYRALRWVRDSSGIVQTETLEVTYADGITRNVRRPLLEIFEPKSEKEVEKGTVARGSGTCTVTGYTTPVVSVRKQFKERKGGANDARLFCVVTTKKSERGRFYRLPIQHDLQVIGNLSNALTKKINTSENFNLIPNEKLDVRGIRHTWAMLYGLEQWVNYFTSRQLLSLITLSEKVRMIDINQNDFLEKSIQSCLGLAVDKQADRDCSLCRWISQNENIGYTFGRQALGMMWDFVEAPWISSGGGWQGIINDICEKIEIQSSATVSFLPNDSVNAFITDPPYYDAVPYSYLSDFFYVWLRRTLKNQNIGFFANNLVPKDEEIIVDRPHQLSNSTKDIIFYEKELQKAFKCGKEILQPGGIGTIVFASKTTASWEAILQAVLESGWIITGSWPIDTEREARIAAQGQARLASSIHLVCRPRENPDGTLHEEIGDWRDVLQELPKRIKEWMPRLTEQGVVGADAIFACLGPALEIFSRYSSVEKASGEIVPLREYLEYVWAAISKEALSTIFKDADTSNFEEDARLTAMWLWTLSAGEASPPAEGSEDDDDDENTSKKPKITGFSLDYETARKIAQGLGAHLENLTHLVEVKGDKARLLPVKERAAYLFGKEGIIPDIPKKKAKGDKQLIIIGILDELPEDEHGEVKISRIGETICDKVHQAMLLFNSGRSEALKRFLVDEAIGKDIKFWQLAQSFSALYPAGSDEKRWVDGLLARKKGLGL